MIYFVRSGEFVKIGRCRCGVKQRISKLQVGNPIELELIGLADGGSDDERRWHGRFDKLRVRGEWFRLDERLLRAIEPHSPSAYHSRPNLADALYGSRELEGIIR